MFTVVTVEEPSNPHRIQRFLHRLPHSAAISCRTEKVLGTSVAYLSLDQEKRINWNRLAEAVGTRPVLLSNRVSLPSESSFRLFSGRRFLELFAANTAIFLLEQCGLPFCSLSLGIVDLDGTRSGLAELAVLHIPQVKILTNYPERLEGFAADMLDRYGAPVVLSNQPDSLRGCNLLLLFQELPDGTLEALSSSGKLPAMVRSPLLPATGQPWAVEAIQPVFPEPLLPFLPADISPLPFLAALYEQNRCSSLRNTQPASISFGGEPYCLLSFYAQLRNALPPL